MAACPINVISLCTGGGGLDLGFDIAVEGARAVVYVEREAFAVAHMVAAMRSGLMGEAPIWSDVTTFNGRPWRGLVDGVIGGIPCQPHSLAGKRLGEDDERDLWSDARRIIVQSRPWFVLIENVAGMLSSGGAERVRRDLRKLGYQVEGGLFSASEVGASHERARCFILGVADAAHGDGWPGERGTETGTGTRGIGRRRSPVGGADVADTSDAGLQGSEQRGSSGRRNGPEAHGSTPELRGASVVDAESERRGKGLPEPTVRRGRDSAAGAGKSMGDAIGGDQRGRPDVAQRGSDRRTAADGPGASLVGSMGDTDDARQHEQGGIIGEGGRWPADASGGSLPVFAPGPSDLDGWRGILAHSPHLEPAVRRMADGVAARLDLTGPHAARVDRLRMLGNGVVPLQAAFAIRTLAARLAARGAASANRLVWIEE